MASHQSGHNISGNSEQTSTEQSLGHGHESRI